MRWPRLAFLPLLLAAPPAWAAGEGADDEPRSHFTIMLGGGPLVPHGQMEKSTRTGLNVTGRFGWTARSGFGLVTNLEYAPLKREPADSIAGTTEVDSHLVVATAAPRFTLGRSVFRLWVAAGAGVLVERVRTETTTEGVVIAETSVDVVPTFNGSSGIDLHFFANGGLSIAGAYTRSLESGSDHDFFSVNAGLVFTL